MKKMLVLAGLIISLAGIAQGGDKKQFRAFPITGYFVDLNDSTRIVQVKLPEGISFSEKQPGVLRGVYRDAYSDTALKGFGRCQLIKGEYYYFSISGNHSGIEAKEGDLLYTYMDATGFYTGELAGVAAHYITLLDVYDKPFYDPYAIFTDWDRDTEYQVLDTMVKDIQFTGKYFSGNFPEQDIKITSGEYKDRSVFQVMMNCHEGELIAFFHYLQAVPKLYAGWNWKLSEVFATWVSNGAPRAEKKE